MTKRLIVLTLATILFSTGAMAQSKVSVIRATHKVDSSRYQGVNGPERLPIPPLMYNKNGVELNILKVFPNAAKTDRTDKWTEVYDKNDKLLGYAVYSKPISDTIMGWNSETPVMIALNKKKNIIKVVLLPNFESRECIGKVQNAHLLEQWEGLSIKNAKKKVVDAVSGATYTSRAIAASVQAALSKL